jgi:hypothetical protein
MIILERWLDKGEAWEDPEMLWEKEPSVFAKGGVLETITIV